MCYIQVNDVFNIIMLLHLDAYFTTSIEDITEPAKRTRYQLFTKNVESPTSNSHGLQSIHSIER